MKRIVLSMAAIVIIAAVFTACKKTDIGMPVISLKGNNPDRVAMKSTTNYTDQGATATDDIDGTLTVSVSGSVNMNSAGEYILTYTATDAAGNKATAERTVVVDGALYLAGGYTVEDYTGAVYNGTYPETVSSSTINYNKVNFTKFAFYVNAAAYGTVSGTTITIPQQTILNCGSPAADRTFTGTGTFTTNTTFTINYTETTNGTIVTGHGVYTRN